jgi:L-alanine-DL-glutamate epimerase-like enolase superfamily enzyme
MARKLKEYNLAWIEEPVYPVDDYDAMARIRGETGVTVAAGENIGNAGEARRAIDHLLSRAVLSMPSPSRGETRNL